MGAGMGENTAGYRVNPPGNGHDATAPPGAALDVPKDFTPVPNPLPTWIDIPGVCKEAKRFVALHTLSSFNALAINDGRRVFTADDRGGEFRRVFTSALTAANTLAAAKPNGRRVLSDAEAALVYDCEKQVQWVAPRPAAIQFLSLQF
jgi:hypothetical protein